MQWHTRRWIAAAAAIALLSPAAIWVSCQSVRSTLVNVFTEDYAPESAPPPDGPRPVFDGKDADRPRIDVALRQVAAVIQPTVIEFVPGQPSIMIAFEQRGIALWFDLESGKTGVWFETEVLFEASEQGLLGLAFHPRFTENGRFFVCSTQIADGDEVTRITEWKSPPGGDVRSTKPSRGRVILDVEQPYPNHNGGGIAFGPDGMLYAGYGDGGWRGDPHGHGQNAQTLLGSIVRLDVDSAAGGAPFAIPADNPKKPGWAPGTWAIGVRNPWRFSFTPDGALIMGDVGQDAWEEITILSAGDNGGWNVREGAHCHEADTCLSEGLVDPVWDYDRDDGGCVTGGYVASGDSVPALSGKYVFGDFLSGRLWAFDLPPKGQPAKKVHTLGKWQLLPSAFGRDTAGRIYLSDFSSGKIYRIEAP